MWWWARDERSALDMGELTNSVQLELWSQISKLNWTDGRAWVCFGYCLAADCDSNHSGWPCAWCQTLRVTP